MSNYPLRANKYNWRSFTPETNHYYTDEYTASMYDLYLTDEYIRDRHNNTRRYYRLHAKQPHTLKWHSPTTSSAHAARAITSNRSADAKIFTRWGCTNARCVTEIKEEH